MTALAAIDAMPAAGAQAAIARIAELQALVARAHGAPEVDAPAPNGGATFSSVLAGVSAASAAPSFPALGSPAPGSPLGGGTLGGAPSPFDGLIADAAQRHGIDPALLKGLIRAESNFDPGVTSSAGAGGLVQLMPGTAAALGVADRFDPAQSIDGGARYLRQQLDAFGGDVTLALAAYNAGPGAVRRHDGVPPYAETQAYVRNVQAYAAEYRVVPVAAPGAAPFAATQLALSSIPTTGSGSIT